jgi:hypothetical protein
VVVEFACYPGPLLVPRSTCGLCLRVLLLGSKGRSHGVRRRKGFSFGDVAEQFGNSLAMDISQIFDRRSKSVIFLDDLRVKAHPLPGRTHTPPIGASG